MEESIILTIFKLDNALGRMGDRIASAFGASLPQLIVLAVLNEAGPNGVALSDLGNDLNVTKGNVTGLIDRMERDGLAKRKDDPKDRRVIRAVITPGGRKALKGIEPVRDAWLQRVFSGFSAKEKRDLQSLLDRMAKRAGELEG
jgi:MarR family 2-MHQ and catechol resistance regulon transcriptional repressor